MSACTSPRRDGRVRARVSRSISRSWANNSCPARRTIIFLWTWKVVTHSCACNSGVLADAFQGLQFAAALLEDSGKLRLQLGAHKFHVRPAGQSNRWTDFPRLWRAPESPGEWRAETSFRLVGSALRAFGSAPAGRMNFEGLAAGVALGTSISSKASTPPKRQRKRAR